MNLLQALLRNESGGRNIPNVHQGTSSGQAQGYFQITTGTWNEFGGRKYARNPLGATYEQQAEIASRIPLRRWDPTTIALMRSTGRRIDPNRTLGENLAMNGESFAGGARDGGNAGGGGGGSMELMSYPLRHTGGAGSDTGYFQSNPAAPGTRHVGGAGSGPGYFTSPESTDGGGFDPVGDPAIFKPEDTWGQPSDLAEALGKGVTGGASGGDSGGLFPGYGNQSFDLQYQSAYPNLQPAEPDVSPLAKLFSVGDIGQADMLAQQSGIRRNYG
jgi:hypothetical protein